MSRILRYEVPVDDLFHSVKYSGEVLFVYSRKPEVVEFWAKETASPVEAYFKVVGTGQLIENWWIYEGSAVAENGLLVWHLMRHPGGQSLTGNI